MRDFGLAVMAFATGALLLPACGGAIERGNESGNAPSGVDASQSGSGPATPTAPLPPPAMAPSPPSETTAGSASRSLLAGRSFHAVERDIGGYAFGTAPTNYRETIAGEMMKVCFGTSDAITVCECDTPVFASVNDIAPGGHPIDHCTGGLVCRGGTYRFDEQGRLRLEVPSTTLTWALQKDGADSEAGKVAALPEGIYVRSLIGLGDTLLEPAESCP